jgi:hypothetical protein
MKNFCDSAKISTWVRHDVDFIPTSPMENGRQIPIRLLICRTFPPCQSEKCSNIPTELYDHRNFPTLLPEFVGLIRYVCRKSVPSPWYFSTASSGLGVGISRQKFLQCRTALHFQSVRGRGLWQLDIWSVNPFSTPHTTTNHSTTRPLAADSPLKISR